MTVFKGRTDMAEEAHESLNSLKNKSGGIESELYFEDGLKISRIRVVSEEGAEAIGKPCGTYVTVSAQKEYLTDGDSVFSVAKTLAKYLRPLVPKNGTVMVVGLGNRSITPDSLGPCAVERIIVTRHLVGQMPSPFSQMRSVCAVNAGVLGCTGVETLEIVRGIASRVRPCAVIAIDALASLSTERLCRSFQISDTGIVPGAGACNARKALNESTLGVPVIALGVPTVVDAETIVRDALSDKNAEAPALSGFLVTPKDIDTYIEKSAKVLAYGVNMALQGEMSESDIEQFLG